MKQTARSFSLRSIFLVCSLSLLTVLAWGQENTQSGSEDTKSSTTTTTKSTDINVSTDGADTWYTQPWVWIAGAAVFILLLVALLNSGKGRDTVSTSDRVTIKKTVERDGGTDV